MRRDDTLAACFALSMYEVTECSSESGSGYLTHHDGCATLIRLRGAKAHSSGLAHDIFTAFRIQGVRINFTLLPNQLLINHVDYTRLGFPSTHIPQRPSLDRMSLGN